MGALFKIETYDLIVEGHSTQVQVSTQVRFQLVRIIKKCTNIYLLMIYVIFFGITKWF